MPSKLTTPADNHVYTSQHLLSILLRLKFIEITGARNLLPGLSQSHLCLCPTACFIRQSRAVSCEYYSTVFSAYIQILGKFNVLQLSENALIRKVGQIYLRAKC